MRKQEEDYASEAKTLLYGQLKRTRYTEPMRRHLKTKTGIEYTDGYIRSVITQPDKPSNNAVWAAAEWLVESRIRKAEGSPAVTARIRRLVGSSSK